ncbi:MAG: ATP-binding protein [Gracilimonas sp.]
MANSALPFPDNEFERLKKLADYDLDYSELQGKFDHLVQLAARIAGSSASYISLLDSTTEWIISSYDLDALQYRRQDSLSQTVISRGEEFEVDDLSKDALFKEKPVTTENPFARYCYAIPLVTPDDNIIGALIVLNSSQIKLSTEQKNSLKTIGDNFIDHMEYENRLYKINLYVDEMMELQRKVSHDLRGPISGIIGISGLLKDMAKESEMSEFLELIEHVDNGSRKALELVDKVHANKKESPEAKRNSNKNIILHQLKEKLDNLYQKLAESCSVDLNIDIKVENLELDFPKVKLLQILGNLIANIIIITPENGSVEVSLNLKRPNLSLITSVKSDQILNKIQIDILQSGNEMPSVTNPELFGFQLVRELSNTINGTINIEADSEKGSNISIHIPLN